MFPTPNKLSLDRGRKRILRVMEMARPLAHTGGGQGGQRDALFFLDPCVLRCFLLCFKAEVRASDSKIDCSIV